MSLLSFTTGLGDEEAASSMASVSTEAMVPFIVLYF